MDENEQAKVFMLLASARTGSNLLSSLLSAHPSIKMYGELFNLDTLPRPDLHEALDDPVGYLRRHLYKAHRPGTAAVGFKMFYDHLTRDYFEKLIDPADASATLQDKFSQFARYIEEHYEWPTLYQRFRDAWEFLTGNRTLRVIHLRRCNTLDTLISHKTAFMTMQWWSLKSAGQRPTTLHLDPQECRRYFQKLDAFAADADVAFGAHRKLDLVYEDLVARRGEVLTTIFRFLDVRDHPVSTRMQKQILAPASELVDNYTQLKESFRHTKWHAFFE